MQKKILKKLEADTVQHIYCILHTLLGKKVFVAASWQKLGVCLDIYLNILIDRSNIKTVNERDITFKDYADQ